MGENCIAREMKVYCNRENCIAIKEAGWETWARGLDQIGCLVHLTQFDSVFGLSTVPESIFGHCS